MTHQDVAAQGWIEAYVRGRLSPADRTAFEEHYFECDTCFTEVRVTEKFVAGIRHAARTGLLDERPEPRRWLLPALLVGAAIVLGLTALLVYIVAVRMPAQVASVARSQEEAMHARDRAAELERLGAVESAIESNAAVGILDATKTTDAAAAVAISVPPSAHHVLLVVELPADAPAQRVNLDITATDGRVVSALKAQTRHPNGSLVAIVSIADLPDGAYEVRATDADTPPGATPPALATFHITVERH